MTVRNGRCPKCEGRTRMTDSLHERCTACGYRSTQVGLERFQGAE